MSLTRNQLGARPVKVPESIRDRSDLDGYESQPLILPCLSLASSRTEGVGVTGRHAAIGGGAPDPADN